MNENSIRVMRSQKVSRLILKILQDKYPAEFYYAKKEAKKKVMELECEKK